MTLPWPASLMPVLDAPDPYLESAKLLEEAGSLALAGALLAEAERQFPALEAVAMRRTEFIERQQGAQGAFARWVLMSNRFPGQESIWAKLVRHHRMAGRLQTAEAALADGFARAGHGKLLYAEGAMIAQAKRDLEATAAWLRTAIEQHPGWPEAIEGHNIIRASLAARELDAALEQGVQVPDGDGGFLPMGEPDGDRLRALLAQFESLGCDSQFGFVQRTFGAGALGLFKYADISVPALVRALDKDLAEIFDASDAVLVARPADWCVRIPRAGVQVHTLLEAANPAAYLAQVRRRLRYLAMKLLEELREGQKHFVLKSFDLGEDGIAAVHAAVRRHGPGALLCVRRAGDGHPPGSVEARGDRLWVGFVPPTSTADKGFLGAWVAICAAVAEAALAGR